jgi:hypothetical protein
MSACVGGFSTCRSFRPVNLSKMVTRTRGREAETLETAGDAWDGRRDMLRSGLIGLRQGRSGSSLSSHGMLGFQPNAWFPASPLTTGCVVFDELLFSSFFSFFSLPMPPFQKKKKNAMKVLPCQGVSIAASRVLLLSFYCLAILEHISFIKKQNGGRKKNRGRCY